MNTRMKMSLSAILLAAIALLPLQARAQAQLRAEIAAPDSVIVGTFHAEGAQLYECKRDAASTPAGALSWKFREPIATLIVDGKSIGRHYAGPNWDHSDGSGVKGKAAASVPGATSGDIPWLKLEVTERRGNGILSEVATVQRINTKGGVVQGSCESEGNYRTEPYSADYVFLRKNEAAGQASSTKR
jgi:hypothetical protein